MGKIGALLRKRVLARADYRCEYCLIREIDSFFDCQIDHIVSVKHGGLTEYENLACACILCNRLKGSDLGSIITPGGPLVRFFNPRIDHWIEHFQLDGAIIKPLSTIGIVTTRILRFNDEEHVLERGALQQLGWYPH